MATITATRLLDESVTVTETTLDGTNDTFTFNGDRNPVLIFTNDSGGALSPVLDGADGTVVPVPGVGDVPVSGGYTGFGSIANGATVSIRLAAIREYLRGTITITGGSGLKAQLLEF